MNSKKALEYQFESDSDRKVTLRDLCPQDKAKIGQLIKKLAHEKQEKENLLTIIDKTKQDYEERLQQQASRKSSLEHSQEVSKEIKIRNEIQQLDGEILDLLRIDQSQISGKKSACSVVQSSHQSPNFKGLIPKLAQQQEYHQIFKQQLQCEPSPSFFQSQCMTNRDQSMPLIEKHNQMVQTTQQTPTKEINISVQTPPIQRKVSNHKSSRSRKKELLMAKIGEFERIIQRMNFSRSHDLETSQDSMSSENVFKKIAFLEEELKRMHPSAESRPSQQVLSQVPQQSNEEDILIELLNNSTNYMKTMPQQASTDERLASVNSSIYGNSFLSLVDNIEIASQQKSPPATNFTLQNVDRYSQHVLSKYNDLVRELQNEFPL